MPHYEVPPIQEKRAGGKEAVYRRLLRLHQHGPAVCYPRRPKGSPEDHGLGRGRVATFAESAPFLFPNLPEFPDCTMKSWEVTNELPPQVFGTDHI